MSQVKTLVIMQLKSALIYVPAALFYAAGVTCLFLLLCVIWKFCLRRTIERFFWRLPILVFLFAAYMYCVLELTVFSREPGDYGGVDWRFLARWNENNAQKAFLIANIIMFIPFGILLPMLGKMFQHILIGLPVAMGCSIGIEAVQLRYQLGYCQLDDVIVNSVGFLVGFLVFLVLRDIFVFTVWVWRLMKRRFTGKKDGPADCR